MTGVFMRNKVLQAGYIQLQVNWSTLWEQSNLLKFTFAALLFVCTAIEEFQAQRFQLTTMTIATVAKKTKILSVNQFTADWKFLILHTVSIRVRVSEVIHHYIGN